MKTIKILVVLIGFSLMSTGCNHDHSHEQKSSEKEKVNESRNEEKTQENHRH